MPIRHRLPLLALLISVCCLGQDVRSSLAGTVTDSTGAAVPDAKVIVEHTATRVATATETNSEGRYTILFLQPGTYRVTAEKTGFKKFLQEGLQLGTSERGGLNTVLEVGAVAESVVVNDTPPLLETESAIRGTGVTGQQIMDLPNSGRNVYQMVWSSAGVVKGSRYWGSMENYALGNSTGVSINGGIRRENETVMDGVTNTQPNRDVNFQPPLESVSEVRVQTSNYDASYGRFGGGVIAITTKSGTNALHGSTYLFNKIDELAAMPWVFNFLGREKPNFINNTFGFEVDGPVYLPKLFDGRNRLFFMLAYEGLRESRPGGGATVVPTEAMRRGDFSALPVTIYDPLTTRQEGSQYVRTPFTGNRIPEDRINPVARQLLSYVPLPNIPGAAYGRENYAHLENVRNFYNQWLGKIDYRINDRNNVYFSYGQLPYTEFDNLLFGNNSPAEPSRENPLHRNFYRWVGDWVNTLNPHTVLNVRAGLARYVNTGGNPHGDQFDPRQLGFPDSLVSQFRNLQFPRFNVGGFYTPVGSDQVRSRDTRDSYSYQVNVNRSQGRHQLKAGGELRVYNQSTSQPGQASGLYNFSKTFTQANPARGDSVSGDEVAALLLGYPSGGNVDLNIDPYYKSHYFAAFLHDDFKVMPRLTLNLGLRWDYEQPYAERYDRMIVDFAFDQPSPIAGRAPGLDLRGGLVYAGQDGRRPFKSDYNNVQPRIGAAYQLTSRTVLRGGYGLFYLGSNSVGPSSGFSQSTPLQASVDSGNTPRVTLSNPFPEGLLTPIGNSQGLATLLGQSITFPYSERVLPYSHQWSFGFQQQLPWAMLMDVTFSSNETRRYPVNANLNAIPNDMLGRPDTFYREQVDNPLAGMLPSNPARNGARIARQELLIPFPQYSGLTMTDVPVGENHYNALQVSLKKRYSQGLTLNASYTWGKTLEELSFLNAQDFSLSDINPSVLERRLAEYHAPHKFAMLTTYELPFGRGRRIGSSVNGVLDRLIGGWQMNVNLTLQSGFPTDFPNAPPLEARSARLPSDEVTLFNAFDKTLFPRTAPNLAYERRTWPTRFPDVRLKPLQNIDVSFAKKTRLAERLTFEFRAEMLNAFNHPWFSRINSGGANVTSPQFGWYALEEQNQNRFVALIGKFIW